MTRNAATDESGTLIIYFSSDETVINKAGSPCELIDKSDEIRRKERTKMQIFGTGQVHGPQTIQKPHQNYSNAPAQRTDAPATTEIDQLDISPEAQLASQVRDIPDVRQDVVDRIRGEIRSGTYETDAKLDVALSRLLDEIG